MTIREYLANYKLLMDGAMGTWFDASVHGDFRCSEEANITSPGYIRAIHAQYIDSGARLLRTNTFLANRQTLAKLKKENPAAFASLSLRDLIGSGWDIAAESARQSGEDPVFVGADIGPISEDGAADPQEILRQYYEICDVFLEKKADIFVMETFPDEYYVLKMAAYIRRIRPEAFIIGQFSFSPTGYGSTGFHYKTVLKKASESGLLDGTGFNCGVGAAHMEKFLREILKNDIVRDGVYISVLPNCGYPRLVRGRAVFADSPEYFGEKVKELSDMGADIIGGCCGTTPECILSINKRMDSESRKAGYQPSRPFPELSAQEAAFPETGNFKNRFREKLEEGRCVFAVELDPPFDANAEKVLWGASVLKQTQTDIITIADSPLARSRADSTLVSARIRQLTGMEVMPHLACRDRNRIAMRGQILGAYMHGIRNILVITGDPVAAAERSYTKSVFDYNSIKFMNFLSGMNQELFAADPLYYGGALNQNGSNPEGIAARMKKKMDQGCAYFLSQPVYSQGEIERLAYLKEKTGAKILIGIMPLVSRRNARFIQNEMPGILVPDEVVEAYREDGTREEWEETAVRISLHMIQSGKNIGAGFYFITPFNRVTLIKKIMDQVNLDEQGRVI